MSNEEQVFQELCAYVKTEILGYDENQKLTKYMSLRLRGMKDGKYMANKATENMAHYPFDIILLTFKYIKPRLPDILKTKTFNSEQHRFNYIMAIASDNLNLVYNKAKKVKEEQKKMENIMVQDLPNYENEYVNNNLTAPSKELEEFW